MYSNWSYSPETPNLGRNRWFFVPCDLEMWQIALENNKAALLSNIKLCASFHRHTWIKTVVTLRKRLNRVLASVTLTFDLWPRSFAWTSLLSLVITLENFMMSQWWEHNEKVWKTEGQTDIRTEGSMDGLNHIIINYPQVLMWLRKCIHLASQCYACEGQAW